MVLNDISMESEQIATRDIEELPLSLFREQFGESPVRMVVEHRIDGVRKLVSFQLSSGSLRERFEKFKGTVRFIPRDDKTVYSAVMFNEEGKTIGQYDYWFVYEIGGFYTRAYPSESMGIKRIYEDLERNPLTGQLHLFDSDR